MSGIELFERDGWSLRVVDVDGEPWCVATDVAKALGYRDASNMVRRLDHDEQGYSEVSTPGGVQRVAVINEPGLYRAVFGSQVEAAKAFQKWAVTEVLPSIRRTGGYATVPAMPTHAEALRGWADSIERAETAERELEEAQPMVALAEHHIAADGDLSVREAAQALARDHGIDIGQNRLFTFMRQIRWIDRKSHPYQQHIDSGRLAVRLSTYNDPHTGEPKISTQVRVTPKGLLRLRELVLELAEPGELRVLAGGASS